jgi:hypothetical protein
MSQFSHPSIDLICERFEEFRSSSVSGPLCIQGFLDECAIDLTSFSGLLPELIQIDIQLGWMRWSKQLADLVTQTNAAEIRNMFQRIPRLHDYAPLFEKSVLTNPQDWITIARNEMESRNSWGDAIGPIYYREKCSIELSRDSMYHPNLMTCYSDDSSDGRSAPRFELRGKTIIGRQRSTDPQSLFCNEFAEGNRIVIADRQDALVGREQLSVELLSPSFAIVSNLSSKNAVLVDHVGQLGPGNCLVLPFGFTIRLPGKRLRFSKP